MKKLTVLSLFKKTTLYISVVFLCSSSFILAKTSSDVDSCRIKTDETGLRYQQQSAEIRALQLQTYSLATLRLQQVLAQNKNKVENLAIIADIDETIIDNTPLLVRDMQQCHDFTSWDTWEDWEKEGKPTLIPGALDFFNYANQTGVKIFYVSDRFQENKAYTLNALKLLALPQVDASNVLLTESSKTERRNIIGQKYTVIMLLGDSLPDFSSDFSSKKTLLEQQQQVMKDKDHFGNDWIIFPNSAYGSWYRSELKPWDKPINN